MTAGRRPKYLGHRRFANLGVTAALAVIAALVSPTAAAVNVFETEPM